MTTPTPQQGIVDDIRVRFQPYGPEAGTYTVTAVGVHALGRIEVTAAKAGENADALAGWQALSRMRSLPPTPGTVQEWWSWSGGKWVRDREETNPATLDETADATPTPRQILDLPLPPNAAKAATVRDYLIELLATLWREEDSFSGKRPFGNSGWPYEVYPALITAGYVTGRFDEDGYIEHLDIVTADRLIDTAIRSLGHK